jgi:hypothetical protein
MKRSAMATIRNIRRSPEQAEGITADYTVTPIRSI